MNVYLTTSIIIRKLPRVLRLPVRLFTNIIRLIIWRLNGLKLPPPYAYKICLLAYFALKYKTKIFVETGTYMGDTVDSLKYFFKKLYTVEMNKKLYINAAKYFKGYRKIEVIRGDSGIILPKILKNIHEPSLFWLDAHYCGEGTARGNKDTPIMKEINYLIKVQKYCHIVLIDDARLFDGTHSYPTYKWFKSHIEKKWKGMKVEKRYDIIRITPVLR